jgi:hypothetical protein
MSKGRGKRKDKKKSESNQLLNLHRENRRTYLMIRTSSHSIKLLGFAAKSLGLILQSSFSDTKPRVTDCEEVAVTRPVATLYQVSIGMAELIHWWP